MARIKAEGLQRRALATINITPLVDVLLVLLVIVMLAMPLFVKRMPVSLPETKLNGTPVAVNSVKVALGAGKSYYLGDAKTSLNDVLAHVGDGATVEVYVDSAVTYKELADFTDSLYTKAPKDVVLMSR